MRKYALALGIWATVWALSASATTGQRYQFLPAPQINLSLLYRLDTLTGDVTACQFAHNPGRTDVAPGAYGVTACYRSGEGATNQPPGDYGLVASHNGQEGGVFRVDHQSGAVSVCYMYFQRQRQGDNETVTDQYVVCATPFK